jgi:hypothetical protein
MVTALSAFESQAWSCRCTAAACSGAGKELICMVHCDQALIAGPDGYVWACHKHGLLERYTASGCLQWFKVERWGDHPS